MRCKVEEPTFLGMAWKNSVAFGVFTTFVINIRKLEDNIALFLRQKHDSSRAMLVLGTSPSASTGSGKCQLQGRGREQSGRVISVKIPRLQSLHNKTAVRYMSIFKHARVHIDSVRVMGRYLGTATLAGKSVSNKSHTQQEASRLF